MSLLRCHVSIPLNKINTVAKVDCFTETFGSVYVCLGVLHLSLKQPFGHISVTPKELLQSVSRATELKLPTVFLSFM